MNRLLLVVGMAWVLASPGEATDVTFTANAVIADGDTTYDGCTVIVDGAGVVLTIDGFHQFQRFEVRNGATVTHAAGFTPGMDLVVTDAVIVEAASAIDATGAGFDSGTGPGAGVSVGTFNHGGGGGHGGRGGRGSGGGGEANGFVALASSAGSGGGNSVSSGGAGGGRVRLVVGGELRVDGAVRVDGAGGIADSLGSGGGGSGGGLFLEAAMIQGSGAITARGGSGGGNNGGGGGGGRIVLEFDQLDPGVTVDAAGGSGAEAGGAGSILARPSGSSVALLRYDNGGLSGAGSESGSGSVVLEANVNVRNGARLSPAAEQAIHLDISGDLTVEVDGTIGADGLGHPPRTGPGTGVSTGTFNSAGGAGHGGRGGNGSSGGGPSYGSIVAPDALGSGGGGSVGEGGAGGGAIRVTVGGTFLLDGILTANGRNGVTDSLGDGGGGSGGSLFITAGALDGAGSITANGGAGGGGTGGGGGGGGRIAILFGTNDFTGSISAIGRSGNQYGGAGTIFLEPFAGGLGEILIDNGGEIGAATELAAGETVVAAHVRMSGDAVLSPPDGQAAHLRVAGDMTIDSSAAVAASVLGFDQTFGPGVGSSAGTFNHAGGGGYGGAGGSGSVGGGITYGSAEVPVDLGSGGGRSVGMGGKGGGAIRLTVHGTLLLDGRIRANGGDGICDSFGSGGGGSGGSIFLDVGTLEGVGKIRARGGSGGCGTRGGGGGGGRIAVYYCDATFDLLNDIDALGGGGASNGAAGSIHLVDRSSACPVLRTEELRLTSMESRPFAMVRGSAPTGIRALQSRLPLAFRLDGSVEVRNDVGLPVPDALVLASLVSSSEGRVRRFQMLSDDQGLVVFPRARVQFPDNEQHVYSLRIDGVIKEGATFDRNASELQVDLVLP